jgi:beta-xylosidase
MIVKMPLRKPLLSSLLCWAFLPGFSQNRLKTAPRKAAKDIQKATAGNPVFAGWYADPEGAIFGKKYWIYPTFSAPYEKQVFFDAFSSPDLVNWTKHSRILDTTSVKWAKKAIWGPAIVEKKDKYFLLWGQ